MNNSSTYPPHYNVSNSTNNRLESINRKFKDVVSRHSKLLEFQEHLQTCLLLLWMERNHRATAIFQKRPVSLHDPGPVEHGYFDYLTPFAFKHITNQLSLSNKVRQVWTTTSTAGAYSINATKGTLTVSCLCDFASSMKPPWRHIFALTKELATPNMLRVFGIEGGWKSAT